jgi:mTERF domain-containing protein
MDKLRLIVQKNPRILLYSLDDNLIPKLIFYLIMTLGMDLKQVERTLLSYPYILDYNLDRHILPITKYFVKDLEVSPTEFRGILLKFPRLLTHSLSKIKHVVGYLRYELGLTGAQVKRVLYQAPQVIGLNTEGNLASKVEFLRAAFALNPDQLRSVVAGMPTLLVLSIDRNLQPKTDYLREAFGGNDDGNHEALQEAILRLPTLLGYSLDKRIRPRLQAILDAGLDPSRITVGIPMTAERFDGWLHRRKEKAQSIVPARRKIKGRNPQSIVPAQLPSLTVPDSDPAGRIVHWTRPRSPESRKPPS